MNLKLDTISLGQSTINSSITQPLQNFANKKIIIGTGKFSVLVIEMKEIRDYIHNSFVTY